MHNNRLVSHCHQVIALTTVLLVSGQVQALSADSVENAAANSAAQTVQSNVPANPVPVGTAPSNSTDAAAAAAAAPNVMPSPSAKIVDTGDASNQQMLVKPGQMIVVPPMAAEDLVPTDDINLAMQQVAAYPDSAEASFILAVALTRTSRVEEALKEVQRAKRLSKAEGGPEYFDKMIKAYEDMLKSYPDDNKVRYNLAWAYYMKAYLLAKANPANPHVPAVSEGNATVTQMPSTKQKTDWVNNAQAQMILSALSPKLAKQVPAVPGASSTQEMPHIKGALDLCAPKVVPQIKAYYEAALKNLDDLLARKPDDVWAAVYRAHLAAEFTGNLSASMAVWEKLRLTNPQNPAPYFFLANGYMKLGNLQKSLGCISQAIALRAMGK